MIGKLSAPKLQKPKILREDQWRQLILTAVATDEDLDLPYVYWVYAPSQK